MLRDPALDALLELHGEVLFIHEDGYWVKLEVRRTRATVERPHGLRYSLTLLADFWREVDGVLHDRGLIP